MPSPGATVGCDFAGIVVEVGSNTGTKFQKGDRIAGIVHGSNSARLDDGCFAEYTVADVGASFRIPDNVSDEAAAGMGVATLTVGLSLYQKLGLPMPGSVPAGYDVLIWWEFGDGQCGDSVC